MSAIAPASQLVGGFTFSPWLSRVSLPLPCRATTTPAESAAVAEHRSRANMAGKGKRPSGGAGDRPIEWHRDLTPEDLVTGGHATLSEALLGEQPSRACAHRTLHHRHVRPLDISPPPRRPRAQVCSLRVVLLLRLACHAAGKHRLLSLSQFFSTC